MTPAPVRLSKSRFVSGLQCHRKLWWEVHEPDAPELVPDAGATLRFAEGHRVGALARERFPGGVLIDLPHQAIARRVAATRQALDRDPPAVYEASFLAGDVFCAVDVLERNGGGHNLVEVKSTTRVKPEHLPDVAVQAHVLRRSGVTVERAELMHLNPECRAPDLGPLFVREDVTAEVEALLPTIPDEVAAQGAMLAGPLPDVAVGPHCFEPRECPFLERCWAAIPEHHVTELYGIGQRAWDLVQQGFETIPDLPATLTFGETAERQRRALRAGRLVVEPGLAAALADVARPAAYLDFETVAPAVPVWPGTRPYEAVPVQFSCHLEEGGGTFTHVEWIAEGPDDPRARIAAALIEACRRARAVLMYTPFERTQIRKLAAWLPDAAPALAELDARLVDLKPIVQRYVYHPAFGGSFSLKAVLPALVPELSYEALPIRDGDAATAALHRLIFDRAALDAADAAQVKRRLLDYCKLDTWAMVKLVERLRGLA